MTDAVLTDYARALAGRGTLARYLVSSWMLLARPLHWLLLVLAMRRTFFTPSVRLLFCAMAEDWLCLFLRSATWALQRTSRTATDARGQA